MKKKKLDIPKLTTASDFEKLSDAEKDRVWEYFDRPIPESELNPIPARQRAMVARHRQKMRQRRKIGRPTVGLGAQVVAITLEKGLLARVDAYAKSQGLKRSELIARTLNATAKSKTTDPFEFPRFIT